MTQASLRPPSHLQPRPKAVPTFSSTAIAASSTTTSPHTSRPSSKSRQSSPARTAAGSDVSAKATSALIRRVLCSNNHNGNAEPRPIHELLPPLTSSNDVDLQLYAIIAIVVKDLVQSWYGKITPDQSFVEEVVRIIAHCTTQLESRLRAVDLELLVYDEIPRLVEDHITAYRISHKIPCTPFSTEPRDIYHSLHPHPALSPVPDPACPPTVSEQQEHEAEYRQLLVQGALAVLLPTEDLENACLRTLVADVIAESILGNSIGGKICEGWFIWDSMTKLVKMVKAKVEPKATGEQIEVDTRSRLEKFGLLSDKRKEEKTSRSSRRSILALFFWKLLQYSYLSFISIRFVILGLLAARSQPLRSSATPKTWPKTEPSLIEKPMETNVQPRPILSFQIFPLISVFLNLSSRMPWLSGSMELVQQQLMHGALRMGATNGILDQYIHHLLLTHLSPTPHLPHILLQLRTTLFPSFTIPPTATSPPPPSQSPTELASIKTNCAKTILENIPPGILRTFFGTPDKETWIRELESEFLDVWGDAYLNRHLAYQVLELCVVRVLPEVGEMGVRGLMGERLG